MNDNVCPEKGVNLKELVGEQAEIIDAINGRLDDFIANTLPNIVKTSEGKQSATVNCFTDALQSNRDGLTIALKKLDEICRTFYG
jgi:hypothetical protein